MGMLDSFIWMGLAHITPVTQAIQYPSYNLHSQSISGVTCLCQYGLHNV